MNNFPIIKASKQSLAMRKPVFGVGINDVDYIVQPLVDGKKAMCPYYMVWNSMLRRCYCYRQHKIRPTYIGCTVCDEWLVFSRFRKWMAEQDWEGLDLDKDLKVVGNKVYSPETCLFVPKQLNNLLNDHASKRGRYPIGVHFHNHSMRFQAQIVINGKKKYLGLFHTPEEASKAYQKARKEKIMNIIKNNVYPNATNYLEQHI